MKQDIIDKIAAIIKSEKKFILFSHESPDGDCIGSQLAIALALLKMKKDVLAVCDDFPAKYRFLPGSGRIITNLPKNTEDRVAIFFDIPSIERMGDASSSKFKKVINIDHHVSNIRYGDLNWIDNKASSVGEMIFSLIKKLGVKLDCDIAASLYVAILTDTGMFQYANTSQKTHEVVGNLLDSGIDQFKIYQKVYENTPLPKLKLLGESLRTIEVDCGGRLAYMWITQEMLKKCGATIELAEDIINFARSVEGSVVAVVFKETEEKETYRISLRSKSKKVDVNKIASFFGGGGHIAAAGCTVRGNREEVKEKVLSAVRKELMK